MHHLQILQIRVPYVLMIQINFKHNMAFWTAQWLETIWFNRSPNIKHWLKGGYDECSKQFVSISDINIITTKFCKDLWIYLVGVMSRRTLHPLKFEVWILYYSNDSEHWSTFCQVYNIVYKPTRNFHKSDELLVKCRHPFGVVHLISI